MKCRVRETWSWRGTRIEERTNLRERLGMTREMSTEEEVLIRTEREGLVFAFDARKGIGAA